MHRIEGSGVEADKFGAGKDGFTEGNPAAGVRATEISDSWLDAVQEEIANAIEGSGQTLKTVATEVRSQLDYAVRGARALMMAANLTAIDIGTTSEQARGIDAYRSVVVLACSTGVVQVSVDNGRGFSGAGASGTTEDLNAAAHNADGTVFMFVGENNAVRRLVYSGLVFSGPTGVAAGDYNAVCWVPTAAYFCIVGDGGLISTGDTAFTSRTSGTTDDIRCVAANGNTVIAGTTNGLRRSADGGVTWASVHTLPLSEVVFCVSYDAVRARWYAAANNADENLIYSDDDGLTWTALDVVGNATNGCVFVVARGTVALVVPNLGNTIYVLNADDDFARTIVEGVNVGGVSSISATQSCVSSAGFLLLKSSVDDEIYRSIGVPGVFA